MESTLTPAEEAAYHELLAKGGWQPEIRLNALRRTLESLVHKGYAKRQPYQPGLPGSAPMPRHAYKLIKYL